MRRKDRVRSGVRKRVASGGVRSCGMFEGEWWGAEQEFGWGEPFDEAHASSAERAVPERLGAGMFCGLRWIWLREQPGGVQQAEAEWQEQSPSPVGEEPKLRMRMKPRGSRWRRKRRRNSSTGRVRRRCLLACAESRQRKGKLPCSRATSLRLEMATRWVYPLR